MGDGLVGAQPFIRDTPRGKSIGELLCHQRSSLQILPESPKAPWIFGNTLILQGFSPHPLSFHALFSEKNSDLHREISEV